MPTTTTASDSAPGSATPRRRFVFIQRKDDKGNVYDKVTLEVPGDMSVGSLLPNILLMLPTVVSEAQERVRYCLQTDTKPAHTLAETETLIEAGIENFEALTLVEADGSSKSSPTATAQDRVAGPQRGFDSIAPLRNSAEPRAVVGRPRWFEIAVQEPSLVSEAGLILVLGTHQSVSIGRPGKGRKPDFDITELDTGDPGSVSSRPVHAFVEYDGLRHYLRTIPTTNGTFLNGAEIPYETKRVLSDGDRIGFGFRGVELTFRLPSTDKNK